MSSLLQVGLKTSCPPSIGSFPLLLLGSPSLSTRSTPDSPVGRRVLPRSYMGPRQDSTYFGLSLALGPEFPEKPKGSTSPKQNSRHPLWPPKYFPS